MTVHAFIGPSLGAARLTELPSGIVLHPPVAKGDLLALGCAAGDTVVIIDGVFQQRAPVRHKEILALLASGVRVLGAASMGALRAAELDRCGMEGIGVAYERFVAEPRLGDDEVALLHGEADEDYRAMTVPLVDLRAVAAAAPAPVGDALLAAGLALHYTQRSWTALLHGAAGELSALDAEALRAVVAQARTGINSVKRLDALLALTVAVEPRGNRRADPADLVGGRWRTRYLHAWEAQSTGVEYDGVVVPLAVALDCRRIYDPAYPERWRAAMAAARMHTSGLPDPATYDLLRSAGHWLSAEELTLPAADRDRRVFERAGQLDAAALLGTAAGDDLLLPDAELWRRCALALATNTRQAMAGPRRRIDDIKQTVLVRHLESTWGCSGPEALEPAARDRGFVDVTAAARAASRFILSVDAWVPADRG